MELGSAVKSRAAVVTKGRLMERSFCDLSSEPFGGTFVEARRYCWIWFEQQVSGYVASFTGFFYRRIRSFASTIGQTNGCSQEQKIVSD